MGRPLKIAKAVLLTITDTNASTEEVTVSQNLTNLNVIAGMPFIPASSTGGLTGGTTYWILQVTGTSTFTVSATEPSANPTNSPVNLSATTGTSVIASVNLVDSGFNNPDGSDTATNSVPYGVVGGNTSIYGKQTLCRVAIGVSGTGTIYTDTGTADVYGAGTDFANTVAVGTAIQIINQETGQAQNVGFVSSTTATTNAITDTEATGSFVVTSGDATTFVADAPVTFDGNIGGLVGGRTYFVLSGANTTHFQVSASFSGPAVAVTNDTQSVNATQDLITLGAAAAVNSTFNGQPMASWIYADDEAGYIVRQKGKTKYLVTSSTGKTAQCFTANVANAALTPNTMNILATYADASTKYVSALNDYNSEVFQTTVAAGSLVGGTTYTIQTTGTTNWTAVGAASNMTGVTFVATGAGSGTGTAIVNTANPDVIATFNTAYAANTYDGQPNPIVVISNS